MPRAKRQKLSLSRRDSTSAYAASKPLFTALRHSISNSLPQQTTNLTTARDVVQSLHVGLQNDDNYNDSQRHVKYMDSIVEAWRSSTEAFCAVFEEMVKITGEKPEEGRTSSESNGAFVSMLEAARRAREGAMAYTLGKEKRREDSEPMRKATVEDENGEETEGIAVGLDSDSGDEIELAHKNSSPKAEASASQAKDVLAQSVHSSSAKTMPTRTPRKTADKVKLDKSGTRVLWERGAPKPNIPFASLSREEKKEWLKEQAKQKREKQRGKVQEIKKAHESNGGSTRPQHVQLDYEDIAAEVEARIKAKDEAKKSIKAEKKRKRDSGDSFVNPGPEPEVEDTIEVSHVPGKPSKKRARTLAEATEDEVTASAAPRHTAKTTPNGDTIHIGRKGKRRTSVEVNGEGSNIVVKKRKKTKD